MADLNDAHRMFLQGMISRRVCNQHEMQDLCELSCQNCGETAPSDNEGFERFISKINSHIRPLHMELSKGISEDDEKLHYALINLCETPVSRMSIDYTPTDLEFFKKIVEKIVTDSDNGALSSTSILNLTNQLERRITKNNAQDLLERFIEDQWLLQKSGAVSLSIRSILELGHYIQAMYAEDITVCALCKKLVLKGQYCADSDCTVKIHKHCSKRYFKDTKDKKCPKCKTTWKPA